MILTVIFYSAWNTNLIAQENNFNKIVETFQDYSKAYREVVYCHLNKSTYIKGEDLGFSAYVLNKYLKTPSKTTKNLYCLILDSTNTIVKSKLIKVNNGFSHNIFKLDSVFVSGNYTFKAYTNWMKNFDEPNIFIESFNVIDPSVKTSIVNKEIENELDVQFLPEGGHFVNLIRTNVGVVIKNKKGYGVPDVKGSVYDTNDKYITEFTTNSLGIGRFPLHTEIGEKYYVKIIHLNKSFQYLIDNIELKGIALQVNKLYDNLILEFKTNNQTLSEIAKKPYKLFNHNGKGYKMVNVQFDKEDLTMSIQDKDLFPGINIFTLFNEENVPVLERMFFNYKGINFYNLKAPLYSKSGDSLRVSIPLEDPSLVKDYDDINVSISVLPEETKSYNKHQNLVSYTYLQPYLNGYIENAAYYFTNISSKKKYDLDNLLITQGWSSYRWNSIFDNKGNNEFVFEDGIMIKANQNDKSQRDFILYPLKFNDGLVVNLSDDKTSFVVSNLYPEGDENLGIGVLNKKGKVNNPNLHLEFFPSKIPDYQNRFNTLNTKGTTTTKAVPKEFFTLINLNEIQQLDEIVIESDLKKTKLKRFQDNAFNEVDVFDDKKRARNLTFVNYVTQYLPYFIALEERGFISLTTRMPTSLVNGIASPIVYLDDLLLQSLDILVGFNMNQVDYVAVNRNGSGEGFLGANGVIRIYTSAEYKKGERKAFKAYDFPLTFSESKKFYVPKYVLYNDDFFKEYGVIDWIPNCKLDENGNLHFTVSNLGNNNINFFIEGVSTNGTFFLDTKKLTISHD
jgi:hypothetical protein